MTEENKQKVIELYKLGVTQTAIAKTIGVSRATISRFLNEQNKNIEKIDSMIGQRFGRLVVLSLDKSAHSKPGKYYLCECDCGTKKVILGSSLRSGHTKSCGCLQRESVANTGHKNVKNLIGQRFGKLVVLNLTGFSETNKAIWHCKCDCGRETDVRACNLISGNTSSCGCLQSVNEANIQSFLTQHKIKFQPQYVFSDLYGTSKPLRFDFAIFNSDGILSCLIEYQGSQHWDINNPWHTEQLEEYDSKKKQYCEQHNIPLFYLDKNSNIEEELERICLQYGYKLSRDN